LVIDDDVHARHYSADFILNQNLHAPTLAYPCAAGTRLLLGPEFALLRPEFSSRPPWTRVFPERPRQILVTLGGSDEDNVTLRVMRALATIDLAGARCRVLAGSANPHAPALAAFAAAQSPRFEVVSSSSQMADEMAAADLAVSAGGSTCWELAFMGLPSVVISLAPNQDPIGRSLAERGVALCLGRHTEVDDAALAAAIDLLVRDRAQRADMSARGRRLVDGRGAARVAAVLKGVANGGSGESKH
jgi:spore coat polysaccharide biosynthesis predicted glycosyltransferase SpsG